MPEVTITTLSFLEEAFELTTTVRWDAPDGTGSARRSDWVSSGGRHAQRRGGLVCPRWLLASGATFASASVRGRAGTSVTSLRHRYRPILRLSYGAVRSRARW